MRGRKWPGGEVEPTKYIVRGEGLGVRGRFGETIARPTVAGGPMED
jgi:hypothetical protein